MAPDPETVDLITIRTFTNEFEANLAKSALEAFGIHCMLSHDDCGGQRPHLSIGGGIRLLVRSLDAEQAREVFQNEPPY